MILYVDVPLSEHLDLRLTFQIYLLFLKTPSSSFAAILFKIIILKSLSFGSDQWIVGYSKEDVFSRFKRLPFTNNEYLKKNKSWMLDFFK